MQNHRRPVTTQVLWAKPTQLKIKFYCLFKNLNHDFYGKGIFGKVQSPFYKIVFAKGKIAKFVRG